MPKGRDPVGTFAVRSPVRPNPIASSIVRLEAVEAEANSPQAQAQAAEEIAEAVKQAEADAIEGVREQSEAGKDA